MKKKPRYIPARANVFLSLSLAVKLTWRLLSFCRRSGFQNVRIRISSGRSWLPSSIVTQSLSTMSSRFGIKCVLFEESDWCIGDTGLRQNKNWWGRKKYKVKVFPLVIPTFNLYFLNRIFVPVIEVSWTISGGVCQTWRSLEPVEWLTVNDRLNGRNFVTEFTVDGFIE